MNNRSEALASRLEAGAKELAAFAATLNETEWQTDVPGDGRKIGVVTHHVASMYPIEIQLAQLLAAGQPVTGVTWDVVATINGGHAKENGAVTKEAALALLAGNSATAAVAIRALTDEELDRAAPVSLNSDAPLTCQSSSRIMRCGTVTTISPESGPRLAASFRLMCVLAHPDDESLGMGGTLARYAAERVGTYVVTATRGERGRSGSNTPLTPEAVGRLREAELRAAAGELGVREVSLLGYCDGGLDRADPAEAIGRIVAQLRRVKPQVVLTFAPDGAYGHPDHVAICQFTTAAVVCAADADYHDPDSYGPHRVSKLYYLAWRADKWAAYQTALRKLAITVDGVERQATPWPDWAVTTVLETNEFRAQVWRAVSCHQSQMGIYRQLSDLTEGHHRALWGSQEFYRAMSLVNGGRQPETDLFEGLRETDVI